MKVFKKEKKPLDLDPRLKYSHLVALVVFHFCR